MSDKPAKSEKIFVFEFPMKRYGCFFMTVTSFAQYQKENPYFDKQLLAIGIKYKNVSTELLKFEYC